MLLAGLTGGIGSGKSYVAQRLERHGALIIDADVVARDVVEPGTLGLSAIVARFGRSYLLENGSLDRAALGQLVFSDDDALADLNGIIHPLVREVMGLEVEKLQYLDQTVIEMIPLLVESGRYKVDVTVVVDCEEDIAVDRLVTTRGLTEKEARRRLAAQATRAERRAAADFIIDNSGTLAQLDRQVDAAWQWLENHRTSESA